MNVVVTNKQTTEEPSTLIRLLTITTIAVAVVGLFESFIFFMFGDDSYALMFGVATLIIMFPYSLAIIFYKKVNTCSSLILKALIFSVFTAVSFIVTSIIFETFSGLNISSDNLFSHTIGSSMLVLILFLMCFLPIAAPIVILIIIRRKTYSDDIIRKIAITSCVAIAIATAYIIAKIAIP